MYKYFWIEKISAKECIALQKTLDSTLFSGFEGAIRHLWSRSEQLKYFLKNIGIKKISAKECSALQKALDSTLFSSFEGAIRHLWSDWPELTQ